LSPSLFTSSAAAAVALVLLPLLSKVGTQGKNIINTFDLLTGEWLGAAATRATTTANFIGIMLEQKQENTTPTT